MKNMFWGDWQWNWKLSHLLVVVFLSDFTQYIVSPAISDVFVDALCPPAKDECSVALYLTGFQQAIRGVGATVLMPVLGNLSDVRGRKKLLLIPLTLAIFPTAILSWQRTTVFFYAYYALKCLTDMVTGSGVICIALAYLADNVGVERRVSAFGILSGVVSAANLSGTFAARCLSTSHIFQVATAVSVVGVVYTVILLEESNHCDHSDCLEQPILSQTESQSHEATDCESSNHVNFFTSIPSPNHIICLLKNSTTFSLLAGVNFFSSLGETAILAFLLYYLKARFHFKKDQFADILVITYAGAMISNSLFLPAVAPFIGEDTLLIVGLFAGFLNMLLDGIAWSPWVPYASAPMGSIVAMTDPTIRSLVSKEVGGNEQGVAQGCLLGITSLTYIASPLIFTPLSAIFFAEDAPSSFTGFSIVCIALAYLVALMLGVFIKFIPRVVRV